jgi:FKBP-type peptidyl-prolyl cis-trans isomerase
LTGVFLAALFLSGASAGEINSAVLTTDHQKILESWGQLLAQEEKVAGVEISSNEISLFLKGFLAGSRNQPLPYNSGIFSDLEQLAKSRREKVTQAIIQQNLAQANAFVAELKKDTNVFVLPDNVLVQILSPGKGQDPKLQQTVNVHYIAQLIDGREFYQAGPVDIVLVTNRSLCRGWISAIGKIRPGGEMKLYVPPPLSESDAAQWGIEPGAMMIFDIELLSVKDTSADDLTNALIPPPPSLPPGKSNYNTEQIIEAWGWDTARRARLNQCRLDEKETTFVAAGLAAAMRGEPSPADLEVIQPEVEKFVDERRKQTRLEARQERTVEMEKLFADLKNDTNVVELPDGLRYKILKPGDGTFPKEGQTVLVNYAGHLIDGRVFDKTMDAPLRVVVGSVIRGWNEGVQKISEGGKIKLYIPPTLAYGEEAVSGIPAGSTLIFEIELVGIKN